MLTTIFKYLGFFVRADLILPLILIIVYVVFLVIARGVIPTSEELINTFSSLYAKYGYEIIFFAAFFETLVLVNLFVPGQLAMALGVIFARSGQTDLLLVILTAIAGSLLGYLIDFVLGSFGFSSVIKKAGYGDLLIHAKKQLKKFGSRGLVLGFVHSNIGSFLSLVAGAVDMPWMQFIPIAVIATSFWLTLWGILIYIFGDVILVILTKYAFLIVLLVISGLLLNFIWKAKKEIVN